MKTLTPLIACSAMLASLPLMGINECSSGGDDDTKNPPLTQNMPLSEAASFLMGETEFIELGTQVAPAGDLNGDGKADLFVSGLDTANGGVAYVVAGPIFGDITLDSSSGGVLARFMAEYNYNSGGWALAAGCDFNGDGTEDFLIGAPMADISDVAKNKLISGDNGGKAYLQYGGPELAGTTTHLENASIVFTGEKTGDTAGISLACLGDIDADGYDDIAISSERNARNGAQAGAVYVYYGCPGLPLNLHKDLGTADAIFVGEHAFDFAGHAVASAGDANGDGIADMLISAYANNDGGSQAGKVYLVAGSRTRWTGTVNLAQATAAFTGLAGERAGWSIAGAGNVNGSGPDDILIGTFAIDSGMEVVGSAYLVYGASGVTGSHSLTTAGARFVGETIGDGAGSSVSWAGDTNGDGYDDLLLGALNGNGMAVGSGKAWLVRGRANLAGTVSLASAEVSLLGEFAGDLAGDRLSGTGDLDGDGNADIVIGARGYDTVASGTTNDKAGAAYVLYGP